MQTKQEIINRIITSILVHMNGYSWEEAKELAPENVGHPVYEEIEEVVDDIILYGIKE